MVAIKQKQIYVEEERKSEVKKKIKKNNIEDFTERAFFFLYYYSFGLIIAILTATWPLYRKAGRPYLDWLTPCWCIPNSKLSNKILQSHPF